jgi:CRISPR-associated endonuclease Cas1
MNAWFRLRHLVLRTPQAAEWPAPAMTELEPEPKPNELSPASAPVHVLSGSGLVRVEEGVLVVERPGETAVTRPIDLVSAVHIHGWATISTPAVTALLGQGSPIVWRSASGYPVGYSSSLHAAGLAVREQQFAARHNGRGIEIARALVAGKIVNMAGVIRRRDASGGKAAVRRLGHLARKARLAPAIADLLGLEGAATAQYFGMWPAMISERANNLEFAGRTRRPPRDAVNAALSYSYAVLLGETLAAVVAAGLEPRLGFLHAARAARPALALDLMEPFRPLIADRAVLAGLNTGRFEEDHFEERDGRVWLSDVGRRLTLVLLEERLAGSVTLADRETPCAWREAVGLQAKALAAALAGETPFAAVERP